MAWLGDVGKIHTFPYSKWCTKMWCREDFPGGPMVKTLSLHCRGCRFKPLVRELRSCRHSVAKKRKKEKERDFPGATVQKNPPAKAGDRFDPWPRKIPHKVTRLVHHDFGSLTPPLLKPVCLEPVLRNKRSHRSEKQRSAALLAAIRESLSKARRPSAATDKYVMKKIITKKSKKMWCQNDFER